MQYLNMDKRRPKWTLMEANRSLLRFDALTIEMIYDEKEQRIMMRFGELIIEMANNGKT